MGGMLEMRRWIFGLAVLAMVPVVAMAQMITTVSRGGIASGDGATAKKAPNGGWLADNGRKHKTCRENQIAIASTNRTVIRTLRGETKYPDGLVACYNPSEFGGAAQFDMTAGDLILEPAKPDTPG